MAQLTAEKAELKVLGEQLSAKRKGIQEFLDTKKTDAGFKLSPNEYDEYQSKKKEIEALATDYDTKAFVVGNAEALDRMNSVNNDLPQSKGFRDSRSIGELVTESQGFKNFNPRSAGNTSIDLADVSAKTLMTTSAGFSAPNDRTDIVVQSAQRGLTILNLLPVNNTNLTTIKYMQETTATNSAATRAEGAAIAQSALAYTQQSANVTSIAHFIPVTEEQLEDVPMVQGLINDRLGLFLQQKLETQLLSGNGTGTNLTGILNTSGIQTQAKGTDAMPDTFLKAITNVRISGGAGTDTYLSAEASAIIISPIDYQKLALLTDTTGRYIFGDPSKPDDFTIWGIKPTITTAIAAGTSLVGDFRMYAGVWLRKGVTIEVGYNQDDFSKLIRSIRGVMRAGITVYRPGAFCQITGL
jgi:HK97 family phage major capsid protein